MSPGHPAAHAGTPGGGVCRERDATRDPRERFAFDGYDALDAGMRGEFGDLGWWFDTSALTAEETVEELIREGDRAILPPVF